MMDVAKALDQKRLKKAKDIHDKKVRDAAIAKAQEMVAKWDKRDAEKKPEEKEVVEEKPKEEETKEYNDPFIDKWEAQLEVTENEIERAKIQTRIAERKKQLDKQK